jgi:leucyl-tRNA synthetase
MLKSIIAVKILYKHDMEKYNHKKIEKKWQEIWAKTYLYKTRDRTEKPKFYALDMFPYPSGEGLHVGHPKGYIATDVVSRYMALKGYEVLHPMGWDAFGLPAETYAINNHTHPRDAVEKNIKTFKKQLEIIGFNYDWGREINTTDPEYYKWTQWIFLQMFKKGLAYESEEPINWCPTCKTGLANEDLQDGKCEICGTEVVRKPIRQWVLKITDYAEKLLEGLNTGELDWEDQIIEQQKNWIGKSIGTEIDFPIKGREELIKVFTTRVDTIFGCTYVVLAPEHELVTGLKDAISNYSRVEKYLADAEKKSDLERSELQKDKTGVRIEGIVAINPFNGKEIPIFVADYVLGHYGTGAVMAVPAHDERDFDFAKKFKIPVITSIKPDRKIPDEGVFTDDGILVDSGVFTDLSSKDAREKMTDWLEKKKLGGKKVNYKMHDWVFSRQRYWGEPIPLIHCEKCGVVPVPENELPVTLPDVEKYEPTGTGESPLANIDSWVNVDCPKCQGRAKRETNTMPQWAGSSWYYLRYLDPKNNSSLVDKNKERYWMPVDLYVGGAEHATRHLLYARFWHRFLYDQGIVSTKEPFKKLVHVGLIQAEDGRKMSKRWKNVVNPDDVVLEYGADSLRLYEMFMGPFSQSISWSVDGLRGMRRFVEKIWRIAGGEMTEGKQDLAESRLLHKTIKKVGEDIGDFKFNTAISSMMILVNYLDEKGTQNRETLRALTQLISPFAPHLAEEIWQNLGEKNSVFSEPWPVFDKTMVKDEMVTIAVQINGKVRDQLIVNAGSNEKEILELARKSDKVQKYLQGELVKVIYVEGRLLSLVVK